MTTEADPATENISKEKGLESVLANTDWCLPVRRDLEGTGMS